MLSTYRLNLIILTLLAVVFSSCLGQKEVKFKPQLQSGNCYQTVYSIDKADKMPDPIYEQEIDSTLTSIFSCKSLNVANAIGLLESLSNYIKLQETHLQSPTINTRLSLVECAQEINQRITIATLEILSLSSDISCEEVHISQIAEHLRHQMDKSDTRLTVSAIVVGGVSAIATGYIFFKGIEGNLVDYIGIATGITETTLGVLALTNNKEIEIIHRNNALQEIWEGPKESSFYPQSIWYYLNFHNPMCQTKKESIREHLVNEWGVLEQIWEKDSEKNQKINELFFGVGGMHTIDQLETRVNMLCHLKAHINQMKQDLNQLMIEFVKVNQ